MKKAIVKLVNFTPYPIETMLYVFKNMHGQIPDTLTEFCQKEQITDEFRKDFVRYLAAEPLTGGIQEFVSTVWCLKNVSRAFQQQLTRHRTAAYSIQSLRVVDKKSFALNEEFHLPDNAVNPGGFLNAMHRIECIYQEILGGGERTEVARGLLPLNIYSPITMCINLRNLVSLFSARLCRMAQGEFREVARMMVDEVCAKMGQEFSYLFCAPCDHIGFCPHAEGCGFRPKLKNCENKYTDSIKLFVEGK